MLDACEWIAHALHWKKRVKVLLKRKRRLTHTYICVNLFSYEGKYAKFLFLLKYFIQTRKNVYFGWFENGFSELNNFFGDCTVALDNNQISWPHYIQEFLIQGLDSGRVVCMAAICYSGSIRIISSKFIVRLSITRHSKFQEDIS